MDELLKIQLENMNRLQGDDHSVECKKCNNRGYIFVECHGSLATRPCECAELRKARKLAEKSNCADLLKKYTLDNYEAVAEWQKDIKAKAEKYIEDNQGTFFIGGQVGSGKTHICTAIINELLKKGVECRYYVWGDVVTALNSTINDDVRAYNGLLAELSTVKCIYLDDFFRNTPSQAERDKAFKIINARYNADGLLTVVSSERLLNEIIDIDEAVGTRLYEMCRANINVQRVGDRNIRIKKIKDAIKGSVI